MHRREGAITESGLFCKGNVLPSDGVVSKLDERRQTGIGLRASRLKHLIDFFDEGFNLVGFLNEGMKGVSGELAHGFLL